MSRRALYRRIYAVAAGLFLVSGLSQLFRGCPLGWAAIVAAVLIVLGFIVAVRTHWGRLIAYWGLVTGFAWLLTVLRGLIGWAYDFPYAGWTTAIGLAAIVYWQDHQNTREDNGVDESTDSQGAP